MSLTPAQIQGRLEEIEQDLAKRQNLYEEAAEKWHRIVRDKEYKHALAFVGSTAETTTERREIAKLESALIGQAEEAEYQGLKVAISVMEARAMIGMALLKSMGRA